MRLLVLGPLSFRAENGDDIDAGTPRQRAILAYLGLHAGESVSIDALVDLLWGDDPPDSAVKTIQAYVSRLRKSTGLTLPSSGNAYRLDLDPTEVDANRMDAAYTEARRLAREDNVEAGTHFEAARRLWRGPPLADLPDSGLARIEAAHQTERHLTGIEDHFAWRLDQGDHAHSVGDLERHSRAHPTRERGWRLLMTALYRSGRQADALRAFQDARTILRDELGIDPGPDLVELEDRILRHDDSLAWSDSRRSHVPGPTPVVHAEDDLRSRLCDFPDLRTIAGRRTQLDELHEWFREQEGPALRLVVGDAGLGKSALLAAFASELDGDAIVIRGSCSPGLSVSYQPMIEATRDLLARCSTDDVRRLCGADGGLLTYLMPELQPALGPPPPVHRDVVEQRVLGVAFDLWERAGAVAPMLMVIDDLMWASDNTMAVVRHAMRHDGFRPLHVIATHRPLAPADDSPFSRARRELATMANVDEMTLPPLDADGVAALLAGRGDLDDERIAAIVDRSGGHPLFAEALARGQRRDADERVPQEIRDTIVRWAEPLDGDARALLAAFASIGPRLDDALAAEAIGTEPEAFLDALDAGEKLGLITAHADGSSAFSHELVRDAFASQLPPRQRRRLDAGVFKVLAPRSGAELVHGVRHGVEAGTLVDATKLADASRRAAEQARRSAARHDEARFRAIEREASVRAGDHRGGLLTQILRAAALHEAGSATFAAERRIALDELDDAHWPDLTVLAGLELGDDHAFGDVDHDRVEVLRRAVDLARGTPDEGRVAAALATTGWATLSTEHRRDLIAQALGLVPDEHADRDRVVEAVLWPMTEPATAERRLHLANALAERSEADGAHRAAAVGHNAVLGATVELGLCDAASIAIDGLRIDAAKAELPAVTVMLHSAEAGWAILGGRLDEADGHLGDVLIAADRAGLGAEQTLGPVARPMLQLAADRGTLADLEAVTAARAAAVPEWAGYRYGHALCRGAGGSIDQAGVDALVEEVAALPPDMGLLFNLHAVVMAADLVEAEVAPQPLIDRLAPFADRFEWSGSASFGPVRLALAAANRLGGRPDEAITHARRGLALTEQMNAPLWAARLERELALVVRDASATDLWERARRTALERGALGIVALLDRDGRPDLRRA